MRSKEHAQYLFSIMLTAFKLMFKLRCSNALLCYYVSFKRMNFYVLVCIATIAYTEVQT